MRDLTRFVRRVRRWATPIRPPGPLNRTFTLSLHSYALTVTAISSTPYVGRMRSGGRQISIRSASGSGTVSAFSVAFSDPHKRARPPAFGALNGEDPSSNNNYCPTCFVKMSRLIRGQIARRIRIRHLGIRIHFRVRRNIIYAGVFQRCEGVLSRQP